ncbi:MAG: TraR/DksA family transcriptional regulator [Acidothermaceae bacterium]
MDDAQVRDALASERAAIAARIAALSRDLEQVISAARDANVDDEHDPEGATIAYEREQLHGLLNHAREQLDDVDHALARVAAGTYPFCEKCSAPIATERLTARPTARSCIRCASDPLSWRRSGV